MKYLLSLSLIFLSLPSFASNCELATNSNGEFRVVDRQDYMAVGREYYLTDLSRGIVITVSVSKFLQNESMVNFNVSSDNRIYNRKKDTYSKGIQVSQTGFVKIEDIEMDYEVTCRSN